MKNGSERAKAKANLRMLLSGVTGGSRLADVVFRRDSSDTQRAQVEARIQAEPGAIRDGAASFGGAVGYE